MALNTNLSSKASEDLSLKQPDFYYNGAIPSDNDKSDYIEINVKGAIIA